MSTNVGAKKRAGVVLIVLGVVLLGVALLPSAAGVSSDGFGPARAIGTVAGLVIALVGIALTRKRGHFSEPST